MAYVLQQGKKKLELVWSKFCKSEQTLTGWACLIKSGHTPAMQPPSSWSVQPPIHCCQGNSVSNSFRQFKLKAPPPSNIFLCRWQVRLRNNCLQGSLSTTQALISWKHLQSQLFPLWWSVQLATTDFREATVSPPFFFFLFWTSAPSIIHLCCHRRI